MIERKKDKWTVYQYNQWLWEKFPCTMMTLSNESAGDAPYDIWTTQNRAMEKLNGWNRRKGEQDE